MCQDVYNFLSSAKCAQWVIGSPEYGICFVRMTAGYMAHKSLIVRLYLDIDFVAEGVVCKYYRVRNPKFPVCEVSVRGSREHGQASLFS